MNKSEKFDRTLANFSALTPLTLLQRSATVYPDKQAVIDTDLVLSYRELYRRCCQMGDALRRKGVNPGDTVAILSPNSHEMLESHYSVPMAGAVINTINIRLDATTLSFILGHGEARVLFYDTDWENVVRAAVSGLEVPPLLISIESKAGKSDGLAQQDYESFLLEGSAEASWQRPNDEWDAIALNYTSGTTGNPKGVLYHHRGAFLAAMTNSMVFQMTPETVYLW
ncbi:MAG: AMP-binding protein, partial [Marinobacter sp.]